MSCSSFHFRPPRALTLTDADSQAQLKLKISILSLSKVWQNQPIVHGSVCYPRPFPVGKVRGWNSLPWKLQANLTLKKTTLKLSRTYGKMFFYNKEILFHDNQHFQLGTTSLVRCVQNTLEHITSRLFAGTEVAVAGLGQGGYWSFWFPQLS